MLQGELVPAVEAFALPSDPTASAGASTDPVLASVRQMQILPWPAWQAIHARFGPLSASLTSETGALLQGEPAPGVEAWRSDFTASAGAGTDPVLASVHQMQILPGQHGKISTPALGHFLQA